MMYVLDTNSLIYFFKGMGRMAERVLDTPPRSLAIPAIVLYELQVGIAKSSSPAKRRFQLEQLLALVDVLPFGAPEATVAARIRAELEKAGTPIGALDTLIAGTALRHGATLVTRNLKEFQRIDGLTVEDWY
ncbi:MAG TPA: type II toxin-antitoxin system VapC family toxin [Thermoanaerobaculia bacterium]|nr:type II toxin-antitoxin system VapC family toxin [Thermoanaerobaculia bacterium]